MNKNSNELHGPLPIKQIVLKKKVKKQFSSFRLGSQTLMLVLSGLAKHWIVVFC